jgi:flagellar protein FlaI
MEVNFEKADYEKVDIEHLNSVMMFREFYPVNPPFGHVGLQIVDDEEGKLQYYVLEPNLNEFEEEVISEIKEFIIDNMDVPLEVLNDPVQMRDTLDEAINMVFKRYKNRITQDSHNKFHYFLARDFLGYGKINVLMDDPFIEDISCNGVDTPLYIWHTVHESMPCNLTYEQDELHNIVTRLVYKTGHQISVANPILEGTLPRGYRAHITLDEVSKRGDTFTIRKFRSNPFTIIDQINQGTISTLMGAYFWTLIEFKRSVMVSGAVASGKTALLNSIGMFIKPDMKTVTIEETRELRLHENWIPMITRPSFQPGVMEIGLYDLLRSALRQRPDYIIVGEVRGEETYTLFQSIAVGHGGLCSIHADTVDAIVKRLLTKPMNIPPMMLPLMNTMIQVRRVLVGDNVLRRVESVTEMGPSESDDEPASLIQRFKWDAKKDEFSYNPPKEDEYSVFSLICDIYQIPFEFMHEEMARKWAVLEWMRKLDVKNYNEIARIVRSYYLNPVDIYNLARLDT